MTADIETLAFYDGEPLAKGLPIRADALLSFMYHCDNSPCERCLFSRYVGTGNRHYAM